jgi:hypothetical protein
MEAPKEFEFFASDNKAACFGVLEGGVVTFSIQVEPDSPIRGTEVFNRMMDHFGDDAIALQGVWVKGAHGRQSINIDKVNELISTGVPLQKAVEQAWTVTRAMKRGFRTVRVLQTDPKPPGPFSKVTVLILR